MAAAGQPGVLGRYRIEAEIGRGMMGVVYRAVDPALGRTVALKTVSLLLSVPDEERESFEQRFLNEARVAASLSHPGIVVVHDVGRDADTDSLYIALEYLEGRTLAERVKAEGVPGWREALRLVARVAEALQHAHDRQIVHRDVKPANIMVLPSGEPKLMDFGIAKLPASQLTSAGEFFGTPSYMSPEQANGEPLDGRSDVFSLGAVLYFLLTGRRAFDAGSVPTILMRVAHFDPPPPSADCPDLPPAVDDIVARAMAKRPEDRYPAARALAEDLDDVGAGRAPRNLAGWTRPDVERTGRGGSNAGTGTGTGTQSATASLGVVPAEGASRPVLQDSSLVLRLASRVGRRGAILLALVAAFGLLLPFVTRREDGAPALLPLPIPRLPLAPPPGHLEFALDHPFRTGAVKVWVDDDLVIDERLTGRVTRKVLSFRMHKGSMSQVLDVDPGEHTVRVEVEASDFYSSRRIRGTFERGETRRLEARVDGGLIKKELTLSW